MIFSLEKRFMVLLLLPVAIILIAVGVAGFVLARAYLLDQWAETTRLKLETAAHQIKMRLDEKLELIDLASKAEQVPNHDIVETFLFQQLLQKDGVRFVDVERIDPGDVSPSGKDMKDYLSDLGDGLYTMELCGDFGFCAPITDPNALDRSLRIVKILSDGTGRPAKRLVVRIAFDSFMEPIRHMTLWPGSSACLVTSTGQLLAHTDKSMSDRRRLGETGDEVEKQVLSEMRKKSFGTVFGKGHPPEVIAGFQKLPFLNWYIMIFSNGDVIMEPIMKFRFYYTVAGLGALVIILILIEAITSPVSKAISAISAAALRVQDGDYTAKLPEDRNDEIGQLTASFNGMVEGLQQRELIERTFGRYVDKTVAEELMHNKDALRLGGEKRTVTVMMSDLRNFTAMSEKLQPEEVIKVMNTYFAAMIQIIEKYRGIIVDFYGDSILVFFNGVESDVPGRAFDAVTCALEMQTALTKLVSENAEKGFPPLGMGIGIHTGEVIVGNIGTESRAKYGIVGSNVNLTDRIQATAGSGKVVISEPTFDIICGSLKVSQQFKVCLKGVEEDKNLFEIEAIEKECELRIA